VDSDGDGLSDEQETNRYRTDPRNPDSDGDGLSDGDEINVHGTEPLIADSDHDGLGDGEEVHVYGTNPASGDSDEDGLGDGDEVTAGTDPLNFDTDGDDFPDSDDACPREPGPFGGCPATNAAPVCRAAVPSISTLWPPNHQWVPVSITGVTDPDGDSVTTTITGIRQDEPVNTVGDGNTGPDGAGVGTPTALLRAERSGTPRVPGNGRLYYVSFEASDGLASCLGTVQVGVPHDQGGGRVPIDDGSTYDSTRP
jgi:hypothetical protein